MGLCDATWGNMEFMLDQCKEDCGHTYPKVLNTGSLDFNLGPNENHFDIPEMDKCQTDADCANHWWFKPLHCADKSEKWGGPIPGSSASKECVINDMCGWSHTFEGGEMGDKTVTYTCGDEAAAPALKAKAKILKDEI